jgi:acetyltransferase-like isoleucine patch superfamily enzyme
MGVQLGENCRIYGNGPNMWGTEPFLIRMGSNVYITDGCCFVTHDGGTLILRSEVPDLEVTAPIVIGSNVYIGLRTVVLPGVTIGNRVVIGAGSVVTRDVPDNSVCVGVPARVIKSVDEYFDSLRARSLHFGHLSAKEKEIALRKHFSDIDNWNRDS